MNILKATELYALKGGILFGMQTLSQRKWEDGEGRERIRCNSGTRISPYRSKGINKVSFQM